MSGQEPELEALMIAALRADLPAQRDRERIRARLIAAGVAVSAGTTVGAVASAAQAAAVAGSGAVQGALAGGKLAGLSLAAKIGWSAAVIATASTLTLAPQWSEREPEHSQPEVVARAARSPRPAVAVKTRVVTTQPMVPSTQPVVPTVQPVVPTVQPSLQAAAEPAVAIRLPQPPAQPVRLGRRERTAPPVVVAVPAPSKTSGEPGADLAQPLPADAQAAAPVALAPGARAAPARAPGALRTEPVPAAAASSLRAEADLIARALSALHAGEHDAARHWLALHAQRFPNGALRLERERAHRHLRRSSPTPAETSNAQGDDHD